MVQKSQGTSLLNHQYILLSFIKFIQQKGLKEQSELNLKKIFSIIKRSLNKDPFMILCYSFENCKPFCEVKTIRIRRSNQKVPAAINLKRQKFLIYKWILTNAINRLNLDLSINLADEIMDTYLYISETIKTYEESRKIAESNKMYIRVNR